MAADKDKMLSSANYYAGLVTVAKNDCLDVFVQLITPINEIEREWKGMAGTQLAQDLEKTREKIRALYDRLVALESQMKSQAGNIYDTWPEEETDMSGGVKDD